MNLGILSRVSAIAAVVTIGACVTVNIYFPAPEIREAAEEIVEETWGGESLSALGSVLPMLARSLSLSPAVAHAADIDVSTAAIRQLKAAIQARSGQLKPRLDDGSIGINAKGLLESRALEGLALKDQAQLRRLIAAENGDRLSLYREIAKANDLGEENVAEIQGIFAQTWRQKAQSGWWVEDPPGTWTQR